MKINVVLCRDAGALVHDTSTHKHARVTENLKDYTTTTVTKGEL